MSGVLRLWARGLRGTVTPPPSKSLTQRVAMAEALAGRAFSPESDADDVGRVSDGIAALLARAPLIDCGASGAALRFLLPLASVLAPETVFTGTPRLLMRPMTEKVPTVRTENGLRPAGRLRPGRYVPESGVSSQFVSGLLFSLPLLEGESVVVLGDDDASRPYGEMTRQVLELYGIGIEKTAGGYRVPGGQRYRAPEKPPVIERDWSAAAFFLAAAALGQKVQVKGLTRPSLQGDAAVEALLRERPELIDLRDIPDLFPPLALFAALQGDRVTRFTGTERLRSKESDRVGGVCAALGALGVRTETDWDTVSVFGAERLHGGTVESRDDHRIAMLAGIASAFAAEPVRLIGGESVKKSYAAFWDDFRRLGGFAEEEREPCV